MRGGFVQRELENWPEALGAYAARLVKEPDALERALGISFTVLTDDPDVRVVALLQLSSGHFVGLFQEPERAGTGTAVLLSWLSGCIRAEIDELLEALSLGHSDLIWVCPEAQLPPWGIWRRGADGVKELMHVVAFEHAAMKVMGDLAAQFQDENTVWMEPYGCSSDIDLLS